MKKILVTGGCGYIGSHIVKSLLEQDFEVIIFDSLEHGFLKSKEIIEKITKKKIIFFQGDTKNKEDLRKCFEKNKTDAVIHLAAHKSAGESVYEIEKYYLNNVFGLINLIETMIDFNVKPLIFSSSAAVYGTPQKIPLTEESKTNPENPYGETKLIGEMIIQDYCRIGKINCISLRYFNVCGADKSHVIGEDPSISSNLIPKITQVITGKKQEIAIYGNDYQTPDGTGIRDYIHVSDLAKGHIAALMHIKNTEETENIKKYETFNLGTNKGYSVLEIIKEFERQTGKKINFSIKKRRQGDPAIVLANADKAKQILNWRPENELKEIVTDVLGWLKENPNGYSN